MNDPRATPLPADEDGELPDESDQVFASAAELFRLLGG